MQWILFGLGVFVAFIFARRRVHMAHDQGYAEAQQKATLERQRFLQRLDHELKNPLTALQLALANLEDATDADRRREIRLSMQGQIFRVNHLIRDLRKLVTLDTEMIEFLSVDTRELLNEVTLIFQNQEDNTRHFTTDFDPYSLPTVIGDRDLLQLVIYNLMDNAFKFTDADGHITLDAHVDQDDLVVQIADTGRGISDYDLPHVWEDLYRSKDVHGIPGSGIGLSLVKSIIERHQGTVAIESVLGKGTCVTLTIPVENSNNE